MLSINSALFHEIEDTLLRSNMGYVVMSFEFDFDKWAELAKKNPALFEDNRREVIEEHFKQYIKNRCLAEKRLLQGLQFRIDMERRKSKNPMDSIIRLSCMLMEQFYTEFHPALCGSRRSKDKCVGNKYDMGGNVIPIRWKHAGMAKAHTPSH